MAGRFRSTGRPGAGLRMLNLIRPYLHYLGAGIVCTIFVGLANLAVYWIIKDVIDQVLTRTDSAGVSHQLNLIILGILVLFSLKGLFYYGQVYLMAFVGQRAVVDLRNKLYTHLQRLSISFHEARRTGDMISRITNDVATIQTSLSTGIADLLLQVVTLAGIVGFMFYLDWKLSLVTIITIPAVAAVVSRAGHRLRTITALIQGKIADITSVLEETLSGIRIVKAFTMERQEIKRFARENEDSFAVTMRGAKVNAIIAPLVELLAVLGTAAVLWYGGHQVIRGSLTLGEFMAFLGCVGSAPTPMGRLSATYASFQQALGAADRVFALLDVKIDVVDDPNAVPLPPIKGHVEFKNVSFAYGDGELALDGINLSARPGEVIAFVGPSGAGKTTLVNLLLRFYDPLSGSVEIDGYDLRNVQVESLRRQIGLVPQDVVLFGVTVRENIAYGKDDATLDEIIQAAKMANAHDFIMKLPAGYETRLGERGVSLSGGQRQRIAIARAILRNPRILILDEATSSLDAESEALIQEALARLVKDRTTFIIAHRLSTVRNADKIVVLDRGKIVEVGTHLELLAKGGLYSRLSLMQFSQGGPAVREEAI